MLLETAAGLIDKRLASLRCGVAPLHALLELELAARAIRQLASELDRLQGAQAVGGGLPAPGALRGPPVLTRRGAPHGPSTRT